ncbi:MAG: cytochrome c oxidase subunit II [Acidimicrobiia bacterium]
MHRTPRLVRLFGAVVLIAVVVLFTALIVDSFFNDGKQLTTLTPKGPSAQTIQNLLIPVTSIAAVVFVLVMVAALYIARRFRERDGEDPEEFPNQLHGNTPLEIGWTILPALILAGIGVGTVIGIIDLNKTEENAIKVEVAGQQWWWQYRYDIDDDGKFDGPRDIVTSTEMVIPVGRPIQLTTTSNDVIHSFWIPGLNGKRDAVPGMKSPWKLQADDVGWFRGQCTENCGLSHANMRMLVRAIPASDFSTWVANQQTDKAAEPTDPVAKEGRKVWQALCAQCHVINGINDVKMKENGPPLVAGVAPNLTHLMTRGTFAGSIFNLYDPVNPDGTPGDPADVAEAGDPGAALLGGKVDTSRVNRVTLEAWLRNAPALKPMYPQGGRGMPALGLTEEQIDQLVAFLETLN